MKTVLIFPPTADGSPSYFGPPYGIALLAALLDRDGQAVAARDYDRQGLDAALVDVSRVLEEEQPDLIGLSCLSANRAATLRLVTRFKELAPRVPVVVGGAFATVEPELMLRTCAADFVCIGDGEETLLELTAALRSGGGVSSVAGLAWRDGNRVCRSAPRQRFSNLDSLPHPKLDLFPVREMLARHRQSAQREALARICLDRRRPFVTDSVLMLVTTRGCPWKCTFCPMSLSDGRVFHHSPAYVVDLVERLVDEYDHRAFAFGDNNLTLPREHILGICDLITERRLDIEWIAMTRADLIDAEVLDRMAAAGCREISYGIESLSPAVQRTIGKRLDPNCVHQALNSTHAAGISTCMMLMVGNQGETAATLRQTVDAARELRPDRLLIYTTRVYPGTSLWQTARQQGVPTPDLTEPREVPAPLYTGESSPEELADLESMLQHRNAWVELGADPSRDELERRLLLAAWRAEHTILGGGEPFSRDDLSELAEFACHHQIHDLQLYTTGYRLNGPTAREVRRHAGVVHTAIVPLYSMLDAEHDRLAGSPGALRHARKGMLAWRRSGGNVTVWAFLHRTTAQLTARWVSWLAEHGVTDVLFVFHRSPPGWDVMPVPELPPLLAAADGVAAALARARRLGVTIAATGIPECVLNQAGANIRPWELGQPFDEQVSGAAQPRSCWQQRRTLKTWVPACEQCCLRPGCEGLWSAYRAERGDGELVTADQPPPERGVVASR